MRTHGGRRPGAGRPSRGLDAAVLIVLSRRQAAAIDKARRAALARPVISRAEFLRRALVMAVGNPVPALAAADAVRPRENGRAVVRFNLRLWPQLKADAERIASRSSSTLSDLVRGAAAHFCR